MPENMEEELVDLTEDLVKFKTTKGREDEIDRCLEYIKDFFSSDEFIVKEYESGGKKSLMVSFDESMDPEILLHGHIDVVEAPEEMFKPEVRDGKIYGRGTGDMKAGVACLMSVMESLAELEETPSVALMIVSDEEVGGFNGAKYLLNEIGYSPKFGISAEPNNLDGYMDIVVEQKGILQLKLTAEGKSAHGSKPWKGVNAADRLIDQYTRVRDLFEEPDEDEWRTTMNLGQFHAGEATNSVPDHAEAYLDIRYASDYTPDEILSDLEEMDIGAEAVLNESMLKTDDDNPYVQQLKSAAENVIDECRIARKEPGSDMRFLTEKGVPAVVFGPEGYHSHGDEEHAVIDGMADYCRIIKRFVATE